MEISYQKKVILFFAGVVLFVLPGITHAAVLSLKPAAGSYHVGDTVPVGVYVTSADQAMNAASGVIAFSQNTLKVSSISKSGSIFSLWVQNPSFSNAAGTAHFEGIILNPGFTGSGAKLATINFQAIAVGTANVSFSNASVLANDGNGTEILSGQSSASFTITEAQAVPMPPAQPEVPPAGLAAPVITNYPSLVNAGGGVFIKGTAPADSLVTLFFENGQKGLQQFIVQADDNGNFSLGIQERFNGGEYTLYAQAEDAQGNKSPFSKTITIIIEGLFFLHISMLQLTILCLLALLFALPILFICIVVYDFHRLRASHKKVKKN